jgi:hypothetical protein
MNYSDRIAVRLAQFPADSTEPPYDGGIDLAKLGFEGPDDVDHYMTINWAVPSSDERGLPLKPYGVELVYPLPDKENGGFAHNAGPIDLDSANGHLWSVNGLFPFSRRRPWGVLCLALIARTRQGETELYCRSFSGGEIYGTRLTVGEAPRKCAFFGPNIFALCASSDIEISEIAAFTVPPDLLGDEALELLASVGPAFEPRIKPFPWAYDDQSYLSLQNLSPKQALGIRQWVDGVARGNTPPPTLRRLTDDIHRQNPSVIADAIHAADAVVALAEDLDACLKDPAMRFKAQSDAGPSGSGTDAMYLTYAQILQMLARKGPVEALTLGNAVTVPRPKTDGFPAIIDTVDTAFDIMTQGRMPYPLVRVRGEFYDPKSAATVEEFAFAGLDLPFDGLRSQSGVAGYFAPKNLDAPATAAIGAKLHSNASALILYASQEKPAGTETVTEDNGKPKAFFPNTPDPNITNPQGLPELWLGAVEVPLTATENAALWLYPRDIFGRWPRRESAACTLNPWPVGAPDLLSCEIFYAADETISATIRFEWDRTLRRVQTIDFGLTLSDVLVDQWGGQLAPNGGMNCPAFPTGTPLRLEFDPGGAPANTAALPGGVTIAEIQRPSPPANPRAQPAGDRSRYELTIPIGSVREVMGLRRNPMQPLRLWLVADASERVSGTRRTRPPLKPLYAEVHDPRPPVLDVLPWAITWTALPRGELNEARATLPLPYVIGEVPAQSFNVWRAQETAVLAFAAARHFADEKAANAYFVAVRREIKLALRLAMIQRLVEPRLTDPYYMEALSAHFTADQGGTVSPSASVEIVVPAHQTGFEFVLFTATSPDGVASSKIDGPCMRIVAVPRPQLTQTPALRVISWDDAGYFETAGLCMAIVSYPEPFASGHVRLFWDRGGSIADGSELRFELPLLAELTLAEAKTYVAGIAGMIERAMPYDNNRIFTVSPPLTGDLHHFSVELKAESVAGNPASDIPSLRSQVSSLYLRAATTV